MPTPSRRRNLLIIETDQQRADTIAAYGNPLIRTPNLDRLAASSALFEQAYCAQPVCSPSRASLVTGLYPHTHGMVANCGELPGCEALTTAAPTLTELLRPAGFVCGHVGKWHLGNENGLVPPGRRGFDDWWINAQDSYIRSHAAEGYSDYHRWLASQGLTPTDPHRDGVVFSAATAARLPEALGKPAFVAQECIRFLEASRDRPFVLWVNIKEPHPPCFGPFDDLYDPDDVPLPPSWYHTPEPTVPLRYRLRRHPAAVTPQAARDGLDPQDERSWRAYKARYWGLCTLVDKYAGQILDRLEALDLAGDTSVVYTTDHGEMLGEHGLLGKGVPFEGATRVPLLIRVPDLPPRRLSTPVSQVDLMPTLLELLGQPLPPQLPGKSLAPLLRQGDVAPEQAEVVVEWNAQFKHVRELVEQGLVTDVDPSDLRLTAIGVRTIRQGRWKLNVHQSGEHELYDLQDDPGELHNAFSDPEHAGIVRDLGSRLRAWQQRTGDPLMLPDVVVARSGR